MFRGRHPADTLFDAAGTLLGGPKTKLLVGGPENLHVAELERREAGIDGRGATVCGIDIPSESVFLDDRCRWFGESHALLEVGDDSLPIPLDAMATTTINFSPSIIVVPRTAIEELAVDGTSATNSLSNLDEGRLVVEEQVRL